MPPELAALLQYLKITIDEFTVVESKYFTRLKELLVFHKIVTPSAKVNRSNFTAAVKKFQSTIMAQANPDGVPGANTLWAMQKDWAKSRGLTLVKTGIPVDPFAGAPLPFQLRSDVVPHYKNLYKEIHSQGGLLTSAGSLRPLSVVAGPGQSATSMHYTGLAFDMHTGSGMNNLKSDAFIIEKKGTRNWTVWAKTTPPKGTSQSLNAITYNSSAKAVKTTAITAQVINFTEAARKNGFSDIGRRSCFPATYMCAEWWHFQCEEVLVPYISQFGAELLTIYTEAKLTANAPIWAARQKIYGKDWN